MKEIVFGFQLQNEATLTLGSGLCTHETLGAVLSGATAPAGSTWSQVRHQTTRDSRTRMEQTLGHSYLTLSRETRGLSWSQAREGSWLEGSSLVGPPPGTVDIRVETGCGEVLELVREAGQ